MFKEPATNLLLLTGKRKLFKGFFSILLWTHICLTLKQISNTLYMRPLFLSFCTFLMVGSLAAQQQDVTNINFQIKHYKDSVIYIIHNFGNAKTHYVLDTVKMKAGKGSLNHKKRIEAGIYSILTQDKKGYTEFVIHNENAFTLLTDTVDLGKNMKVKGSVENTLYIEHSLFMEKKYKQRTALVAKVDVAKKESNSSKEKLYTDSLTILNDEVEKYQNNYISTYPTHLLSKVLQLSQDPKIPESITNDTAKFEYYRAHYFDKVDFSEEGLVRTPLLENKIINYLDKMVPQHHDSIIVACDLIIKKAKASPEIFKYIVSTLTTKYERSNIMCFDAIFVHLVNEYYKTKQAFWVSETNLSKIITRAKSLEYIGCGSTATDMMMEGLNGNWYKLSKIKSPYTVVWFWDSDCGHCKAQTPKLKMLTDLSPIKDSITVFAVNIENETPGFRKYVEENNLHKWINVSDTLHMTHFRDYYDIYSTPVMYLLDKDKKIMAKRLDPEAIYSFLVQKWKLDYGDTVKLDSTYKFQMERFDSLQEVKHLDRVKQIKIAAHAGNDEVYNIFRLGNLYLEQLKKPAYDLSKFKYPNADETIKVKVPAEAKKTEVLKVEAKEEKKEKRIKKE